MLVKQLSVFLENRKGRLAKLTRVLKENRINLVALSISDTTNFGILRAIVREPEAAATALRGAGFTANITEVLACAVPDQPGGLADVLLLLEQANISVEYLYSFVRTPGKEALILLRVDQLPEAIATIEQAGIRSLTHEEVLAYQA
nr:ACT domain-containing protein [Maliibacterium massiliense]